LNNDVKYVAFAQGQKERTLYPELSEANRKTSSLVFSDIRKTSSLVFSDIRKTSSLVFSDIKVLLLHHFLL